MQAQQWLSAQQAAVQSIHATQVEQHAAMQSIHAASQAASAGQQAAMQSIQATHAEQHAAMRALLELIVSKLPPNPHENVVATIDLYSRRN